MALFLVKITWFGRSYFQVMDEAKIDEMCGKHRGDDYFDLMVVGLAQPVEEVSG